jgi:C4-dicarboxylate-specific signal transduction histidine kinase/CheY-like chemotaxis protein
MPSGGYVMCFTDVTAEAKAIDALVKAQAELEMRVDERTHELRDANRALADADEEKTRFLAAASHDLLQPIHAARLFAAALGRDIAPKQHAILSKLDRSIESADTLLRALLDISRLDAGGVTPQPKPLRLRPLLLEMAETFAPLAREKGLTLRVGSGDATVETDAGLLRSIVQNFLSNAIRHTGRGGIIIGVRRRSGMARIDVIDTGPGIPEDKQSLIFREFERLANANEGGIGLGLAIVDRTARLLDARISLRSTSGKGSRFSVALPLASLQHDLPMATPERRHRLERALKVLVVDDDIANCEAMESYVSRLGHQVSIATTAAQGMEHKAPFDIALVDFNLGESDDGLHLIAALRQQHPGARFALVTATPVADYANRAEMIGVAVLHKPLSAADLEIWLNGDPSRIAAE